MARIVELDESDYYRKVVRFTLELSNPNFDVYKLTVQIYEFIRQMRPSWANMKKLINHAD